MLLAVTRDAREDVDEEKLEKELMRPHVGSRVRALVGDGALQKGEVGEVVEDDRSPIPFKVVAPIA